MSRADALAFALVAGADAALTLLEDGPGMGMFAGTKLCDDIALERQGMALLPLGDARRVLAGLTWWIVADLDPDPNPAALPRVVDAPRAPRAADPEHSCNRASIAGRLAGLLDEVTGREAAP